MREKAVAATLAQAIENEKVKVEKVHEVNEGAGDDGPPDPGTERWSKGDDGIYYPRGTKGGE